MIQVDRSKVTAPASLRSAAVGLELERAKRHLQSASAAVLQTRFRFDPKLLDASILASLQALFRSKCAYCEQAVTDPVIDRFRPAHGALDLFDDVSPAHYLVVGIPVETTSTSPARNAVVAREIAFRSLLTPCAWRQGGSSTTSLACCWIRASTNPGGI